MSIGEWMGLIAVAALIGAVGWFLMEKAAADKLPPLEDDTDQEAQRDGGPKIRV